MKNVLVLMHDDVGQEARFQAASDLTRVLEGHLTCVDVAIVPVVADDFVLYGGAAELLTEERAREDGNRSRMEVRLKVEDIPFNWISATGFLSSCVRDAAALADVVVLNRELDALPYPDMRTLIADVLLKAHKPIVAVPQSARGFDAFGAALVAWDGSPQVEAALGAAIPLLQHARLVTLLEVEDGSVRIPAEQAAEYLSRHGIKPVVKREQDAFDTPGGILLDAIATMSPAYVVMGGFGHSRFVEAAFGGVTRRMLKECPVPIFMAR